MPAARPFDLVRLVGTAAAIVGGVVIVDIEMSGHQQRTVGWMAIGLAVFFLVLHVGALVGRRDRALPGAVPIDVSLAALAAAAALILGLVFVLLPEGGASTSPSLGSVSGATATASERGDVSVALFIAGAVFLVAYPLTRYGRWLLLAPIVLAFGVLLRVQDYTFLTTSGRWSYSGVAAAFALACTIVGVLLRRKLADASVNLLIAGAALVILAALNAPVAHSANDLSAVGVAVDVGALVWVGLIGVAAPTTGVAIAGVAALVLVGEHVAYHHRLAIAIPVTALGLLLAVFADVIARARELGGAPAAAATPAVATAPMAPSDTWVQQPPSSPAAETLIQPIPSTPPPPETLVQPPVAEPVPPEPAPMPPEQANVPEEPAVPEPPPSEPAPPDPPPGEVAQTRVIERPPPFEPVRPHDAPTESIPPESPTTVVGGEAPVPLVPDLPSHPTVVEGTLPPSGSPPVDSPTITEGAWPPPPEEQQP